MKIVPDMTGKIWVGYRPGCGACGGKFVGQTVSRPFMRRGMVHHPEFNNRYCCDDEPHRQVDLHSHRVAVETEDPGARRQPQTYSELEPLLSFDETRNCTECEKVTN